MTDSFMFLIGVALWSAFASYYLLFRTFAPKKQAHAEAPAAPKRAAREYRPYSSHEGFSSFATNQKLTVEDIVTALSKERKR